VDEAVVVELSAQSEIEAAAVMKKRCQKAMKE